MDTAKTMIYNLNLTESKNEFIEKIYNEAMKELNEFYGADWTEHTPRVFLLKDRESIDLFHAQKTEPWLVAWADSSGRMIFVLDKKNFEKESSHKYSDKYYSSLIKHEISHLFYGKLSAYKRGPVWLSEGTAIYTSGQTKLKPKPKEIKNFLEFYDKGGSGVYAESGFVVEALVKKFGKEKLLELIKSLKNISNENQFKDAFKNIYGFSLNYKKINEVYI